MPDAPAFGNQTMTERMRKVVNGGGSLFLGALSAAAIIGTTYVTLSVKAHENTPAHAGVMPIIQAAITEQIQPKFDGHDARLRLLEVSFAGILATQTAMVQEQTRLGDAVVKIADDMKAKR